MRSEEVSGWHDCAGHVAFQGEQIHDGTRQGALREKPVGPSEPRREPL